MYGRQTRTSPYIRTAWPVRSLDARSDAAPYVVVEVYNVRAPTPDSATSICRGAPAERMKPLRQARASPASAGSSSGGPLRGSSPGRSVVASRSDPATMSSGALSLGRKPDFMPK